MLFFLEPYCLNCPCLSLLILVFGPGFIYYCVIDLKNNDYFFTNTHIGMATQHRQWPIDFLEKKALKSKKIHTKRSSGHPTVILFIVDAYCS